MIDPGTYNARATEAAYGYSSKGTEQIAVDFVITSSPNAQYQGAHITWYGYLSPAAAERTLEAVVACGVTDLTTLAGLTSNEVQLEVRHETWDGKTSARVAFVNKLGGIAMKSRMNEAEARAVAARWKDKFAALRGGASSSPNARPVSKGSPHDPPGHTAPSVVSTYNPAEDDIPF